MKEDRINIIGAGAAGLTAAITLAMKGMKSRLIYLEESDSPLNVDDIKIPASAAEHEEETMKAGGYIIDPNAVKFLAVTAPAFISWLKELGAGDVMQALNRERNRFGAEGTIMSFPGHAFHSLITEEEDGERRCVGVRAQRIGDGQIIAFDGRVIMATGGLYGFFPGSGADEASGDAAAKLFAAGVKFSDLEMISSAPQIVCRDGKTLPLRKEIEKYVLSADGQSCLDMRALKRKVFRQSFPGLRKEIKKLAGADPKKAVIPLEMSIDYFPGGIDVDFFHQTSLHGLFAVGECCSAYNGAGVLEENKILSAICGGNAAASFIADRNITLVNSEESAPDGTPEGAAGPEDVLCSSAFRVRTGVILKDALGRPGDEGSLSEALELIDGVLGEELTENEKAWALLAKAMVLSALYRKESRGLHKRPDHPETDEAFGGLVTAVLEGGEIKTGLKKPDENGGVPLTR